MGCLNVQKEGIRPFFSSVGSKQTGDHSWRPLCDGYRRTGQREADTGWAGKPRMRRCMYNIHD